MLNILVAFQNVHLVVCITDTFLELNNILGFVNNTRNTLSTLVTLFAMEKS